MILQKDFNLILSIQKLISRTIRNNNNNNNNQKKKEHPFGNILSNYWEKIAMVIIFKQKIEERKSIVSYIEAFAERLVLN